MAKKTANKKLASFDRTCSVDRDFLSFNEDKSKIYYQYAQDQQIEADDEPPKEMQPEMSTKAVAAVQVAVADQGGHPQKPAAGKTPAQASAPVPDTPTTPLDIVLSLTAQKFKKPFNALPTQRSIRELSGGTETSQSCRTRTKLM